MFGKRACELLDECWFTKKQSALEILKYTFQRWGNQDCISLAVSSAHEEFVAHTCCQHVISKRWQNGISFRGQHTLVQVRVKISTFLKRKVFP